MRHQPPPNPTTATTLSSGNGHGLSKPTNLSPLLHSLDEDDVPRVFICPISLEPMTDPVTLCTGHTYDRPNITKWLSLSRRPLCPTSMQELWDLSLTPNTTLLHLILSWFSHKHLLLKKLSHDVQLLAADLVSTLKKAKGQTRVEALGELRRLVATHSTVKQSVVDSSGVAVLSSLLGPFTSHAVGSEAIAILSNLPLDSASVANLMQPAKISLVVDLLNDGSIETKINCTRFIQILMKAESFQSETVSSLSLLVGLIRLVKDKRYPSGVSAGLGLLKSISKHREVLPLLVSIGAAQHLVDLLPNLKSENLEPALWVLRELCTIQEGKVAVKGCGMAIPRMVKVLMSVNEVCTELGLGCLREICREYPEEIGKAAVEAGVAAKLLLAMQSCCGVKTKQAATELLKLCSLNYSPAMFISKCKLTRTMMQ